MNLLKTTQLNNRFKQSLFLAILYYQINTIFLLVIVSTIVQLKNRSFICYLFSNNESTKKYAELSVKLEKSKKTAYFLCLKLMITPHTIVLYPF